METVVLPIDINARDESGKTPLILAAVDRVSRQGTYLLSTVLETGARQ
jgi:hypothetical protein